MSPSTVLTSDNATHDRALDTLKKIFGFDSFRGAQREIVDTIVRGEDALVLMPTGGGKSLCYQLPALLRDGVAIVVSPLIALMQDQVDALNELGIAASFLNSSQTQSRAREVELALQANEIKLLYVAPERLNTAYFLSVLDRLYERNAVALFAIDEAHCVSQWGHDFRSDYLELTLLHTRYPRVPRIALTATADEATRAEIRSKLQLEDAAQFVSSFDRPNIHYAVVDRADERSQLTDFLEMHSQESGIIYCISRSKVDDTASWLRSKGYNALPYHAGLDATTRSDHQSRFLREDAIIMVATIAFGMGIDKPDVRFVAHLDLPKSIEGYYQETGRAGRDGEPAHAWMMYALGDVVKQLRFIDESEAGDTFKRLQRSRLDRLLALAETTSCRRAVLLDYFGEAQAADYACMNCDNCNDPPETWDATKPAQMLLSAAVRTGQYFGAAHLIDVLRGSKNEKVVARGHDALPVHGIGAEIDETTWRAIVRQLIALGAAVSDPNAYGAIKLTEVARPILRGERSLIMRRVISKADRRGANLRTRSALIKKSRAKESESLLDAAASRRLAALKTWRIEQAHATNVPAFVVFSDATLRAIAVAAPTDSEALLQVSGVGQAKLARYGDDILGLVKDLV